MIALFSDFGLDGLYVGQMHALIASTLPDVKVIDLCHTIPAQDIRAGAYLLPAYTRYLPPSTIIVCVVDPGVGGQRPHALCNADDRWYIGPDNDIFDVLAQQAHSYRKYHFKWPGVVSSSFHARDVYTPAACLLAESASPSTLQASKVIAENLKFSADLNEVVYFDHFGNAITGLRHSSVSTDAHLLVNDQLIQAAKTFSDVKKGQCFWYENANGLVEIAVNQGSARQVLGLLAGDSFSLN